jgi:hypothetical protein
MAITSQLVPDQGGGFWSRKPAQVTSVGKFNPQQQQGFSQILQQALSGLQNPQQGFEPIAQQARTNFKQNIIPGIAERFESMGSNRGSSGLIGSLGAAGAGLEGNLAALGSQYGLQQQGLSQQLAQLGLTEQSENIFQPEQSSGIENLLMALIGGGGQGGQGGGGLGALISLLAKLGTAGVA